MSDKDRIDFLETVGDWKFDRCSDGTVVVRIFLNDGGSTTLRDAIDSFLKQINQ